MQTAAKRSRLVAIVLLALMTALMLRSAWDDTPNADEHITIISGYSYLEKMEYRIGQGNPPLVQDLGALPLLFMRRNEPWNLRGWGGTPEENEPDILGREFLYHDGNDADAIMRAARLPLILLTVALGALIFWWTRKQYGDATALLALFFYTFSPTFLAHGRFVTTDVAAAAGFFAATVAYLHFLKTSTGPSFALAGLAMGFAFLTKYSTVAMIPIVLFLGVVWAVIHSRTAGEGLKTVLREIARAGAVVMLGYLVIYPVYLHHVWRYAPQDQIADAEFYRNLYGMHSTARDIVIWASGHKLTQPWAEYFLGLLVNLKASGYGQSLYFLGKVYPTGFRIYFPFVYLIKEALAFHVLTVIALTVVFAEMGRYASQNPLRDGPYRHWLAEHFSGFALLVVTAVYWTALIRSNMNIGIRHLVPAFPFTYVLVAIQISALYRRFGQRPALKRLSQATLGILLVWQAASVLRTHPSYLAYFNELAGGPNNGWLYVNDSNLDWGQDVKRLAQFVERQKIAAIHVDYFGPADISYYLKDRYQGPVGCGELPKGWVAVSAMIYPGSPWNPQCDFRQRLPIEKRIASIGYSIFVFHVD